MSACLWATRVRVCARLCVSQYVNTSLASLCGLLKFNLYTVKKSGFLRQSPSAFLLFETMKTNNT